jgi:hypothetical protein
MATQLTQSSENFGYSRVRLRRIAKLQFGVVNPNELVRPFASFVLICLLLLLLLFLSIFGESK